MIFNNVCVKDAFFSDHMPILFDIASLNAIVNWAVPVRYYCAFRSDTAEQFYIV